MLCSQYDHDERKRATMKRVASQIEQNEARALSSKLGSEERAERIVFEICEALGIPHILDIDYCEPSELDGLSSRPVIYFDRESCYGERGGLLIALEAATVADLAEGLSHHLLSARGRSCGETNPAHAEALQTCVRAISRNKSSFQAHSFT